MKPISYNTALYLLDDGKVECSYNDGASWIKLANESDLKRILWQIGHIDSLIFRTTAD